MTLAVKMNGMALVTQDVMNASQEDQGNAVLVTKGTPDDSNKNAFLSDEPLFM